jgi:hypothetical protein
VLLRVGLSRISVVEARGQFGNSDEGAYPPLEAVSRELVKTSE